MWEKRKRPTPPSFKRTPAKIIDPKVGASTWAIGNQKWSPYIGSLTEKARKIKNNNKLEMSHE